MTAFMRRRDDGGRIDRSRPVTFSFNGKPGLGYEGDTLASALLANGISVLGRGARHNRPLAIHGSGPSDTSGFVQLVERGETRTVLATQIELYEGLAAESVLPWPPPGLVDRVRSDRHRKDGTDLAHMPVRAGYTSESSFAHCDILVIGSGPAGLAAALAAGRAGARVMVAEQGPVIGGSLLWCPTRIANETGDAWLARTEQALKELEDVDLLTRSTATGIDNQGKVVLFRSRPDDPAESSISSGLRLQVWKVTAQKVILASGAVERPLAFPGNNAAGVMLASAMLDYTRQFAVAPAKGPIAVITNNDRGLQAACDLYDQGVPVKTVLDVRREIHAEAVGPICNRGINLLGGYVVSSIKSDTELSELELVPLENGNGRNGVRTLACHGLAMSGGWNPCLDVLRQAGGSMVYDDAQACFVPRNLGAISYVAGAVTGDVSLEEALRSGHKAGTQAATELGFKSGPDPDFLPAKSSNGSIHTEPFWQAPHSAVAGKALQWIDYRRDLTADDTDLLAAKSSDAVVGPLEDPQLAAPRTAATFDFVTMNIDREIETPRRVLPMHPWHVDHGAAFRQVNGWLRPAFFTSNGGSPEEAITAEMRAGRQAVAITDLSAVGKIEISGADAAAFLDRMFATRLDNMGENTLRYCQLLDESGAIIDHGIIARLDGDRYMLMPSPGNAAAVTEWLESWLASELSHLKVFITPVTTQWATLALSGPRARQVLLELDKDINVSTDAFPFAAVRQGKVCSAPAIIMRTSHTGEVTFEVSVPASFGAPLWELAIAAGTRLGIRAMGEDALRRLAAEKGYIDIPKLAPRALTPMDLRLLDPYKPKASDFVGKGALLRPSAGVRERLQLVALRSEDNASVLPADGIIIQGDGDGEIRQGRVASSFYSEALGNPLTLALVLEGHRRVGDTVRVSANGKKVPARIVKPTLFDPNGRRRYG